MQREKLFHQWSASMKAGTIDGPQVALVPQHRDVPALPQASKQSAPLLLASAGKVADRHLDVESSSFWQGLAVPDVVRPCRVILGVVADARVLHVEFQLFK